MEILKNVLSIWERRLKNCKISLNFFIKLSSIQKYKFTSYLFLTIKSSRLQVFLKIRVLQILQNSRENICFGVSF